MAVPNTLKDVAFITDAFKPEGTGANCGAACHTIAKSKDYVFTRYEKK